ncbi:reverse transcriptase domain-containing protein [Vreelandella sp. EE7]
MESINKFLLIDSKASLSDFFGLKVGKLNYLLYKLGPEEKYSTFEIEKRAGGKRIIDAPIKPLKEIQREIASILYSIYKPKPGVYAYVKDGGIKKNAEVHLGAQVLFKVDIKDFFPTVHIGRVIGLFKSKPFSFSNQVAVILAQICCKDDRLPQGSPASPIISNFICRGLDIDLLKYAKSIRCKYSRYADDIFLSTYRKSMPSSVCTINYDDTLSSIVVNKALIKIFENHGFEINKHKTSVAFKHNRQILAGIKINEKLNIDRSFILQLRAMLDSWKKHGYRYAAHKYNSSRVNFAYEKSFRLAVRGKVEYLGYIKGYGDTVYMKYAQLLSRLDAKYIFNKRGFIPVSNNKLIVYTEGVTDEKHIKFALNCFKRNGEFLGLELSFNRQAGVSGASDLLKVLEYSQREKNDQFKVFLFDDDDNNTTNKLKMHQNEYVRNYGNNIWAVLTPRPSHRVEENKFCIEMYYTDQDLRKTNDLNRRIYLNSEFDDKGFHKLENVVRTKPQQGLILDDNVFNLSSKEKVSLSKNAFAESVLEGKQGFNDMDHEGFRNLFNIMQEIYDEAYPG